MTADRPSVEDARAEAERHFMAGWQAGAASRAVPSDHTATTDDADLRIRVAKRLFATRATDHAAATAPEIWDLCLDAADAVLGLLATARPAAPTDTEESR